MRLIPEEARVLIHALDVQIFSSIDADMVSRAINLISSLQRTLEGGIFIVDEDDKYCLWTALTTYPWFGPAESELVATMIDKYFSEYKESKV